MRKVTLKDIAQEATVSVATVDRVLNGRPGVKVKTVERVRAAARLMGYFPHHLADLVSAPQARKFCFILPRKKNAFMGRLTAATKAIAQTDDLELTLLQVPSDEMLDGTALAGVIASVEGAYDGIAVKALDDSTVREAINNQVDHHRPVVTIVSDLPGSKRVHYIGIDNSAAGRTAASLMGRFAGSRQGTIGIIGGSMALRDQFERQYGFGQVMARHFPGLTLLPVCEGRDDDGHTAEATAALLRLHPDLVGIYNVGAGNRGLIDSLEGAGRQHDIVSIVHELTPTSRKALIDGTIDVVLDQAPERQVRRTVDSLKALTDQRERKVGEAAVQFDIFLRENLP